MTKSTEAILQDGKSYTFSDYFEMNHLTKDIVAALGYQYQLARLELPYKALDGTLEALKNNFYKRLPHVSLNSETARREMLIAPVLLELIDYVEIDIDLEYPVHVNERLKGSIDYLVRSAHHFLVVEAKKADMEKGFTQLAVELIAMDHYTDNKDEFIYGAVTVGDMWRFGMIDRSKQIVYKDIDSFPVPSDMEGLFSVMMGILTGNQK